MSTTLTISGITIGTDDTIVGAAAVCGLVGGIVDRGHPVRGMAIGMLLGVAAGVISEQLGLVVAGDVALAVDAAGGPTARTRSASACAEMSAAAQAHLSATALSTTALGATESSLTDTVSEEEPSRRIDADLVVWAIAEFRPSAPSK